MKLNRFSAKNGEFRADLALAAFSGLLLALSMPNFDLWPLAWVGLSPLLFVLVQRPAHHGAALGFTAGLVFYGITVFWLRNSMIVYAGMPVWLALIITLLAAVIMSFYTGIFGYLVSWISGKQGEETALLASPFLWVSFEHLRGVLPPLEFPWARVADSQYSVLLVIQMADITGVEGLSLAIAFISAALALIILWAARRTGGQTSFPVRWTGSAIFLVVVVLAYGFWTMERYGSEAGGERIKAALVQGNIDQARKWEKAYRDVQMKIYFRHSRQAASNGAQLIVWPETAAPFYFGSNYPRDTMVKELARELDRPILFGAPGSAKKDGRFRTYNRAWLVNGDGQPQKYDKVRLAPFGEYVPLKKLLFFVRKMVEAVGDLEAGEKINLLDAGDYRIGPQICFEIIFPAVSRQMALEGAAVFVNITNDSWFGKSPASRQSLAMAVFRAVENRTPVLRAAQSGVSAIIAANGEITAQTGLFTETIAYGNFTPRRGPVSIYTRSHGVFPWICLLFSAWLVFRARRSGGESG